MFEVTFATDKEDLMSLIECGLNFVYGREFMVLNNSMLWRGVSREKISSWRKIFNDFVINGDGINIEGSCPVCGRDMLHIWYSVGPQDEQTINGVRFVARGSIWEWCSSCRSYEHGTALVPAWWADDLNVDETKLSHDPEAIEAARVRRDGVSF